jgi:hypothetical protein
LTGRQHGATMLGMALRSRLRILTAGLSAERLTDMVSLAALALLAVAVITTVFPGL